MELVWLHDFLALVNNRGFSRAAAKRNVTQPAFTRRVRKLEYAVGCQLFDRSSHPITLTEAGRLFLPVAKNIILEWENTRNEIEHQFNLKNSIKVSCLQTLGVSFVPSLVSQLYQGEEIPHFQIFPDNFANCIDSFSSGASDVLISYCSDLAPLPELPNRPERIILDVDKLVPVCKSNEHGPLYSLDGREVPYLAYSSNSFLRRVTKSLLTERSEELSLQIVYEDPIGSGLKTAAELGLGIAWLPLKLVRKDIARGKLVNLAGADSGLALDITIAAYRNGSAYSKAVDSLWEKIKFIRKCESIA